MISENKIYPQPVIERSQLIYDTIFADGGIFDENEMFDTELATKYAMTELNELFLPRFIDGKDMIFASEDEVYSLCNIICANYHLNNLKKKGLVESIENEHGEEVFFLTQEGKEVSKNIIDNESTTTTKI